jgi:hypothetical protein
MDKKVGEAIEMPVKKRAGKHCGVRRNAQLRNEKKLLLDKDCC